MRGIIIAAGLGNRMGELTNDRPKCMLPIAGRPLLDWTIDHMRAAGCREIVVITGYKRSQIRRDDIIQFENTDYENNNILHSLICAREALDGPVMVSYSDIRVEPIIQLRLAEATGDIVVAVDRDWKPYYEGRTDHPVDEAENMYLERSGKVRCAGKHLRSDNAGALECTEFLGLWRMSSEGTARFCEAFDAVNNECRPTTPFQQAREWRKAYITDFLQHLIDKGSTVNSLVIEKGWAELDTIQDYQRLPMIAASQGMRVLASALASHQKETVT